MNMSQRTTSDIADDLSELFHANVSVDECEISEQGDMIIAVAQASYYQDRSNDSHRKLVRQTVVLLIDSELDLPQFDLDPKPKGAHGVMLDFVSSLVGNIGEMEFEDDPEFSESFILRSWTGEATRILFTPTVRQAFVADQRWSVSASDSRLALYQRSTTVEPSERDAFIQKALETLAVFQDAEAELDKHPELPRKASATSMVDATDNIGGFIGASIRKQLLRIRITPDELEQFARATPPRAIPPGMSRQIVGETFILIPIGALFFTVGLIVGTSIVVFGDGMQRFIGLPFMIMFPLIGFCMMFFTIQYRRGKQRILQRGEIVLGKVTSVKRTSTSINNQQQYHVRVEPIDKNLKPVQLNVYGGSVDTAKEAESTGKEIRLLIDPVDETKAVGLDLLVVFE